MSSILVSRLPYRILPALSLTCLIALSTRTHAADVWPSAGSDSAATARIQAALGETTQLDFIETPLEQVVDFLQDQHDIPIQLDARALDDVGIGTDVPLTRTLKGISLRSALRVMLAELDLTYVIENEVLTLTTLEAAAARPETRVYNVSRLLAGDTGATELAAIITQALHPGPVIPVVGGQGGGFFSVQDGPGGQGAGGYGGGLGPGVQDAGGYGGGVGGMAMGGGGMGGMAATHPGNDFRVIPHKQLLIVRHTTIGQHEVGRLLASIAAALDTDAVAGAHAQGGH